MKAIFNLMVIEPAAGLFNCVAVLYSIEDGHVPPLYQQVLGDSNIHVIPSVARFNFRRSKRLKSEQFIMLPTTLVVVVSY